MDSGINASAAKNRQMDAPSTRGFSCLPLSHLARTIVSTALIGVIAISTACARGPDKAQAKGETEALSPTDRISMAELQKRIIAYADSLKSRSDISPERFANAIGVVLTPDDNTGVNRVAKDLRLTEGYNYAVSYLSIESRREFPSHEVIFYQLGRPAVTDDPGGVCYWDMESASRDLEALGYRSGGEAPFQRGGIKQYWRPIGDGRQGMDTSLLTYRSGAGDNATTCVYAVQFGGGDQ